jgi:GNAT superfamily N-acetyltransferase
MSGAERIAFREATAADMPGISHVRLSVTENASTAERLQERGITDAGVAASLLTHRKGWVAERDGRIVGFSMADRADWSIFALFVLPEHEQQGLGSRLLDLALAWLWDNGAERVWLSTGPHTRAAHFYAKCGWTCTGAAAHGDLRFELARPAHRSPGGPALL